MADTIIQRTFNDTISEADAFLGNPTVQEKLSGLTILNLSASGYIHNALKRLENYYCGEFFDGVESGEYKDGIMCIDLTNIPFNTGTVDIIISEDVMEHVQNVENALQEIYRVLAPSGFHYFTVPLHQGKQTASREAKKKVYHGDPIRANAGCIVYTDWGEDINQKIDAYGFRTTIKELHHFYDEYEITDVDCSYDEYVAKKDIPECYFKYNSIVICADKEVANPIGNHKKPLESVAYKIFQYNKKIMALNEKIAEMEQEIVHRGEHIQYLDKQISDKDERILQLQAEVYERNNYIKQHQEKCGKENK